MWSTSCNDVWLRKTNLAQKEFDPANNKSTRQHCDRGGARSSNIPLLLRRRGNAAPRPTMDTLRTMVANGRQGLGGCDGKQRYPLRLMADEGEKTLRKERRKRMGRPKPVAIEVVRGYGSTRAEEMKERWMESTKMTMDER